MKITAFSTLASVTVPALFLGIAFNALPFVLFGLAVSALILCIAATDYAPRHRVGVTVPALRRHALPFAA